MRVVDSPEWRAFQSLTLGERVKGVRATPLSPGGRVALTLFEAGPDGGRAHPRLRTDVPPVDDSDSAPLLTGAPSGDLGAWLRDRWAAALPRIEARSPAPAGSAHYHARSLRQQRTRRFLTEARSALGDRPGAALALRLFADDLLVGTHPFDDSDTGTYHSFGHDAPFVHYLERLLESLPEDDSEAFATLDGDQQESIRRQRRQCRAHLDHLMRHKYAYDGIVESDIERSLGGFLIDRETRRIVSEDPATHDSLVPAYQLLRIAPGTGPHAGEWVYRDGETLRLQDGTQVEVPESSLRATPVDADSLTFRRAPDDPRLRANVRFDWDGNGYVQAGPVSWVGWAGHCDIKAILESLGVTLADNPSVTEWRSDTGAETVYDRDLLLEMIASVIELGSSYVRTDGSGRIARGVHRFAGARNDSRPDRLQFQGPGPGKSFRWPLGGRQESFRVTGLSFAGKEISLDRAFFQNLPAETGLDIVPNPRFLQTIEGDYNLIDASGGRLKVRAEVETFDPGTGYPRREVKELDIDLAAKNGRTWLGSAMKDPARREVYQAWLVHEAPRIEVELERWERKDGRFTAVPVPEGRIVLPMVAPLRVTLSREMRRDDPAVFQSLLDVALRQGQNICADTDMAAEVWNGVVTEIAAQKLAQDDRTRVSHWRVRVDARFGSATLEYLVARDENGEPVRYCTLPDTPNPPDFLWQDFPDVSSKAFEAGDWLVNEQMLERGIVEAVHDPRADGERYVFDDHVKNVYELLYCGLGELPYTVVHGNKRYAFHDEAGYRAAVEQLSSVRKTLRFVT